jgi:hypothetical protein
MTEAARGLRRERKVLFIIGNAENAAVGNGYLEPGMQVLTKLFAIDSWLRRIQRSTTSTQNSTLPGFRGRVCRMPRYIFQPSGPRMKPQDHWHSIVAGR